MKLLVITWEANDSLVAAGFAQASGMPFDLLQLTEKAPAVGAQSVLEAQLQDVSPADSLASGLAGFV
ncbi:MAG: hypothetical protein KF812_11855, partial [Fimbriimonadaceae bacterium]|nr:hypothetical protein [Fimbriimonadaceae bacterium]